jgi:hypothetical protein
VLAAWGIGATVILLLTSSGATDGLTSTLIQELVVAALLLLFGPRGVRRSIAQSDELPAADPGSGEPTPLWHVAAIVIALTLVAGLVAGSDAGLRVTVGCTLVGATQAGVLAAMVGADERRTHRAYFRVKGSRILRGTRLGYVAATQP